MCTFIVLLTFFNIEFYVYKLLDFYLLPHNIFVSLRTVWIVVIFQSVFYLKMHQNYVFLFFKNYFCYQRIKMI